VEEYTLLERQITKENNIKTTSSSSLQSYLQITKYLTKKKM